MSSVFSDTKSNRLLSEPLTAPTAPAVDAAMEMLRQRRPVFAANPRLSPAATVLPVLGLARDALEQSAHRLKRWGPALSACFPELHAASGLIESPLLPLPSPATIVGTPLPGTAFIKADHALPVAGSIKARGGIHEVLVQAEKIGTAAGLMAADGDPCALLTPAARAFFQRHRIGVGSTGNLGLSIGIIAAKLGFMSQVHMSCDAKAWKKARLRAAGAEVIEHAGDYAAAVAAGREALSGNPDAHFVDDENSADLFLGYAVAALRLQAQLANAQIEISAQRPLFVYLPCGVGGAPGGICWGLKHVFGDAAQCFFAEPVASPAFLLRMRSNQPCSVHALGLDNQTEADGLAVARASELVFSLVGQLVNGGYSVRDDELLQTLVRVQQTIGERIEPSAAAGFLGPKRMQEAGGLRACTRYNIEPDNITHLFWTTGGVFVPDDEYQEFYQRGLALLDD